MLSLKVVIVFLACILWSNCDCFKYCSMCLDHTMCQYPGVSPKCSPGRAGITSVQKREIVDTHNRLRLKVANGEESRGVSGGQPKAADLNKLVWDDELAAIAQRWANQCVNDHDKCRNVRRFEVGQNIYWSSETPLKAINWTEVIQDWYDEVKDFDSQYVRRFKPDSKTANYTQIVWHSTYTIGCGRRDYGNERLAVCNYGPTGNAVDQRVYTVGPACTNCVRPATCYNSLCYSRSWHTSSATQGPAKSKQRKRSFIFRKMHQEKEAL